MKILAAHAEAAALAGTSAATSRAEQPDAGMRGGRIVERANSVAGIEGGVEQNASNPSREYCSVWQKDMWPAGGDHGAQGALRRARARCEYQGNGG